MAARLLFIFHDTVDLKINPKGELISPPIQISSLGWNSNSWDSNSLDSNSTAELSSAKTSSNAEAKNKWQVIYLRPPHCTFDCDQDYELLKRVHLALGKNQSRVVIQQIPYTSSTHSPPSTPWKAKSVLIVDPKGFLIMVYSGSRAEARASARTGNGSPQLIEGLPPEGLPPEGLPLEGLPPNTFDARGLLTDIRRLLRFSND